VSAKRQGRGGPWDESGEEDILSAVVCLGGAHYDRIFMRLCQVDSAPASTIFLSAFLHATAKPAAAAWEVKSAVKEQYLESAPWDEEAVLITVPCLGGT
jgi:hypothetical protein